MPNNNLEALQLNGNSPRMATSRPLTQKNKNNPMAMVPYNWSYIDYFKCSVLSYRKWIVKQSISYHQFMCQILIYLGSWGSNPRVLSLEWHRRGNLANRTQWRCNREIDSPQHLTPPQIPPPLTDTTMTTPFRICHVKNWRFTTWHQITAPTRTYAHVNTLNHHERKKKKGGWAGAAMIWAGAAMIWAGAVMIWAGAEMIWAGA